MIIIRNPINGKKVKYLIDTNIFLCLCFIEELNNIFGVTCEYRNIEKTAVV